MLGEFIVSLGAPGMLGEYVIVHRADPEVWASEELIASWLSPDHSPHVRVYGDGAVVEFGTPGEGIGQVRYRIGEPFPNAAGLWSGFGWTRPGFPRRTVQLTRIADEEWEAWHGRDRSSRA